MQHLIELCHRAELEGFTSSLSTNPVITHISADSRKVASGGLFVAISGTQRDGAEFVPEAVRHGAVAIISGKELECSLPVVAVSNPRIVLAKLAAAFYGSQPKNMVAVTGTDGKTSTAEFYRQLAELIGHYAASLGTLGALGQKRLELAPGLHTTPDPVQLHQTLVTLVEKGYTHAALEASSHGIHQYRLDGVKLEAAAFTNLTRDHLDYHGSDENYFAAKLRLFSELLPSGKTAVINADDPRGQQVIAICNERRHKVVTFGRADNADLRIVQMTPTATGQDVVLKLFGKKVEFSLPHVGTFQVYNMLSAYGLLAATEGDATRMMALLPELEGVPGRLERIAVLPNDATVYIDYAHTPAALENVLRTLRPHTQKELHVVFGCGGDRDKGKRPLMGKASAQLADHVIVTDDNPRTEDAATIRKEVMLGCPQAKNEGNREKAIAEAIASLKAGDVLLVAGKGHEKTQTIGTQVHAFDDAEVIRKVVYGG